MRGAYNCPHGCVYKTETHPRAAAQDQSFAPIRIGATTTVAQNRNRKYDFRTSVYMYVCDCVHTCQLRMRAVPGILD